MASITRKPPMAGTSGTASAHPVGVAVSSLLRRLVATAWRPTFVPIVIAVAVTGGSVLAQQTPDSDRCSAAGSDHQAQQQKTEPSSDSNSNNADKLSDCNGVLKPPTVGDSGLEKPAPKVGRTPVIKPSDAPKEQQDGQQPKQ